MAIFDYFTHNKIANIVIDTYGDLQPLQIIDWINYSKAILPVYHDLIDRGYSPYYDNDPGPSINTVSHIMDITGLPYLVVWRYLNALEIAAKNGKIESQIHNPKIGTEIITPGEKPEENESVKQFTERQINKLIIGGGIVLTVYLVARRFIGRF